MSGGLDIRVDLVEVRELAGAWAQAPQMVADELRAATLEATQLLEREVKEETPVGIGGGGGLRGSIAAREPVVSGTGVLGVVGTAQPYAVPVELGTRPHFPPVQPLADWAERKLGVPAAQARDVGFLIARKIARRGTEGAHMFERAFERVRPQVVAIYERAHERIRDRLGAV